MTADQLAERAARLVADWPPPTPEQIAALTVILRPCPVDTGRRAA